MRPPRDAGPCPVAVHGHVAPVAPAVAEVRAGGRTRVDERADRGSRVVLEAKVEVGRPAPSPVVVGAVTRKGEAVVLGVVAVVVPEVEKGPAAGEDGPRRQRDLGPVPVVFRVVALAHTRGFQPASVVEAAARGVQVVLLLYSGPAPRPWGPAGPSPSPDRRWTSERSGRVEEGWEDVCKRKREGGGRGRRGAVGSGGREEDGPGVFGSGPLGWMCPRNCLTSTFGCLAVRRLSY